MSPYDPPHASTHSLYSDWHHSLVDFVWHGKRSTHERPDAPCRSAGSGYETAVCFDKAAKNDDLDLNRLNGELQKKLEEDDRQKLRIAQRLWLQFRDTTCAAERQLYTTGSAAPTVYSACLEAQTRQRIKDLHTTYDWLLSK